MEKSLTVLSEGHYDNVDLLSPVEMNNILGGEQPTCNNGYCQQSYSENSNLGTVSCGCGYVKPIKDTINPPVTNPPDFGN